MDKINGDDGHDYYDGHGRHGAHGAHDDGYYGSCCDYGGWEMVGRD